MATKFYNANAAQLAEQYLANTFEQVHHSWLHLLPEILKRPSPRVLDIGAGAGRDAKYLATQGPANNSTVTPIHVTAVEPAKLLADFGRKQTQDLNVVWLEDTLPALNATTNLEVSYDLILLSAVWMHIPPSDRARAIRKLANLLKPGGKLVISLRHGHTEEDINTRKMHVVCADELKRIAQTVGLFTVLETEQETDQLGRQHIHWQTLVLQMPDDGSGAFPFIRHVAVNDDKSGTHKLALLRVLLRIADGYPGAVIRRESSAFGDRVILPAGLVALYWCHQYKDLIDVHQLYQTTRTDPGMGFMKADGWHKLTHRTAADYRVGNLFTGDDAIAMHKTLSAALVNIKTMPCKYITLPNSDKGVFQVESKPVRAKNQLFLDTASLAQWGEFSLPENIWLALNRYACWIEPVLVNEWVQAMATYKGNKRYKTAEQHYSLHHALNWLEPKRTTTEIRNRFQELQQAQPQTCTWTGAPLTNKYDIDHCMPFARWPNNDLWNLLPADCKVNNKKRDKLPSEKNVKKARQRIQHWWQSAWISNTTALSGNIYAPHAQRFFAEANIALPGLNSDNRSVDDVFEALVLQRGRLKEMQQLQEW